MTNLQKKTAQAIVNIFETSRIQGKYGQVTLLQGDTGHLTYGRSQTTLSSGNLYLLIKAYADAEGALYANDLSAYVIRLANIDLSLDYDRNFHRILREAGDDPVMHDVQDEFFDRVYWNPAVRYAQNAGVSEALGIAVVYDSVIHGSWKRMRDRTTQNHGGAGAIGEKQWIKHYLTERRSWLANHSNQLLRRTVYRMDAFQQIINANNWDLKLPFFVRGIQIDQESLGERPIRVSAHEDNERLLRLRNPHMRGDDVKEVQQALNTAGFNIKVDGIFGPGRENIVKTFQESKGLVADGIVGNATRAALEL